MSLSGIRTVASLELLQRRRTARWPVVLGVWFVVVGGITTLVWLALTDDRVRSGVVMYDITTFLVLLLALLVVPALTSTSINGDRDQGVLASLQTTLLTPADIVLGKLAASFVVALVLLATASPFLVWGMVAGRVPVGQAVLSVLVLAVVLAVVCALGLMFSTLTARPVGSSVLTYLAVATLTIGTLIGFVVTLPLVVEREQVRVFTVPEGASTDPTTGATIPPPTDITAPPTASDCRHLVREEDVPHTERTWGLLALNPFVVVADAAPGRHWDERDSVFRPLGAISLGVRYARQGPSDEERQQCWAASEIPSAPAPPDDAPVWPYGLAALVVLGAAATAVAVRRVRTPMTRLPNGTRVA